MINRWVIAVIVSFVMKQIEKFGTTIDFVKLKAEVDVIVRDAIPGTWFDDDGVNAVNSVLDALSRALHSTAALESIIVLIAEQNWNGAFLALKDLVLKVWSAKGGKANALASELALMDSFAA